MTPDSPPLAPDSPSTGKKHIAVLGGGIGALSTVFNLTNQPGWQDRYDITVYQMGWRLGGKGASGRNPDDHDRIEEHGLHIWFGFYENAFNMMWQVYNELDRTPDKPLATVQEAFTGQNFSLFEEYINDEWLQWPFTFAHTDDFPGLPEDPDDPYSVRELPSLWDYIQEIVQWLHRHHQQSFASLETDTPVTTRRPHWWERLADMLETEIKTLRDHTARDFLELAVRLLDTLPDDPRQHAADTHNILTWLLKRFKEWLFDQIKDLLMSHTQLRRDFILLDLALTCAVGLIEEGVISHSLDHLDDYEFKDWLRKHGAFDIAVDSTLTQSLYDSSFAFEQGDINKPSFAAGTAMRVILRVLFTYKGSIIFKMNAGMGDAIFAPIYQVLKARGVNFKFFHRVTNLQLSADNNWIDAIQLARQVDVKDGAEYAPLIDVKELPCWPDRPLYDQLVQGEALQASGANLESRWADWQDVGQVTLQFGQDFDIVILGISLYALRDITQELMAADPSWHDMVMKVNTTQTQALQLWFKPDLDGMGWDWPEAIIGSYIEEFSSIADFTQTLPRENWNPDDPEAPHRIWYTCGVIKDDFGQELPPPSDHDWPQEQLARVYQTAHKLLSEVEPIWPGVADEDGGLVWDSLTAPPDVSGPDRLTHQYLRVNVDPTERYVLASPGTNRYRKKTDASGFGNLYLCGTWIDSGFNFGCIENGVMTGMQCSRALTGFPPHIVGEEDPLHD